MRRFGDEAKTFPPEGYSQAADMRVAAGAGLQIRGTLAFPPGRAYFCGHGQSSARKLSN